MKASVVLSHSSLPRIRHQCSLLRLLSHSGDAAAFLSCCPFTSFSGRQHTPAMMPFRVLRSFPFSPFSCRRTLLKPWSLPNTCFFRSFHQGSCPLPSCSASPMLPSCVIPYILKLHIFLPFLSSPPFTPSSPPFPPCSPLLSFWCFLDLNFSFGVDHYPSKNKWFQPKYYNSLFIYLCQWHWNFHDLYKKLTYCFSASAYLKLATASSSL